MGRLCISYPIHSPNILNAMSTQTDQYKTITKEVRGEFKDKGSRFIAYAFPIESEEEFEDKLERIQEEHHKARHFCTAFRLGPRNAIERFNDDGEPSGSAGRPILGQLHSFDVLRVGAVVVRYFGGTKLGVSGLIEAYRESTAAALAKARIVHKKVMTYFRVQCPYADMPLLMEALKYAKVDILEKNFEQLPSFQLSMPQSETKKYWDIIATHFVGHSAGKQDLIKDHNFSIQTEGTH